MRTEARVLGALAAASWLIATAALIDWLSGNPTAPSGIAAFSLAGVLLTLLAIRAHRGSP